MVRGPARLAILGVALAVTFLAAGTSAVPASTKSSDCGTKTLFGKALRLRVVGRALPCTDVRRIARGRCREGRVWSCFSSSPPGPVLFWFPEVERFAAHPSTVIEALRRPCGRSRVTARAWRHASRSIGFPTGRQVLADDLLRCHQLNRMSYPRLRALLGPPDWLERHGRGRDAGYGLGPERDSFFQIDDEALSLVFDRNGLLIGATIEQT